MIRAITIVVLVLASVAHGNDFARSIRQREQVTKGLVAYWAMRNSGTTVYDEWTGGRNGTATGDTVFSSISGAVGNGAEFDGNGDYINCGAFNPTTSGSALTVSAWYKHTTAQTNRVIVSQYNTTLNRRAWQVAIIGGTSVQVIITSDGGATLIKNYYTSTKSMSTWRHICFTWNSGVLSLWEDGAAASVTKNADGTFTQMTTLTAAVYIGSRDSGSSTEFSGSVDEVRIYNRVLTADEIKQLYRMGAIPKGIK
jgi:hypothetical protein